MKSIKAAVFTLFITATGTAMADPIPRLEVTPYVGYRGGGHYLSVTGDADFQSNASFGVLASYRASYNTQFEVLYGHQDTDIDDTSSPAFDSMLGLSLDYLQLGGSYVFNSNKVAPYVSLTVGATRLSPDLAGIKSETYFSGSFGVGVRYDLSPTLGLRLEGRTFGIFGKSDTLVFCGTVDDAEGCLFQGDGSFIPQFEVSAGVSFRFK